MKHQAQKHPTSVARQAGLTLIELTIVLLILIGLSGLLLPFVQGFIDKTHDSANTDSLKEVAKQIESYNNLYSGYPENLESLYNTTTSAGTTYGATAGIIGYLMRPSLFVTSALTGTEATQFNNSGISLVRDMNPDPGPGKYTTSATIVGPTGSLPVASGLNLVKIDKTFLTSDATLSAMGMPTGAAVCSVTTAGPLVFTQTVGDTMDYTLAGPDLDAATCLSELLNKAVEDVDTVNNDYYVLGIGNDASLIGRTMSEAPIHFARVGGMNASNRYNHILAVFEVRTGAAITAAAAGGTLSGAHPAAVFKGTIMPMMQMEGITQAQESYYAGDGV